jgi:hypothetical protein
VKAERRPKKETEQWHYREIMSGQRTDIRSVEATHDGRTISSYSEDQPDTVCYRMFNCAFVHGFLCEVKVYSTCQKFLLLART